MLRFKTGLNYGWRYTPDYSPKKSKNENFDLSLRPVDIPHNSGTSKYSYYTGEDESKIVQYSKLFVIPDEMEGKRIILHFDGVMSCAAVFVNDKAAFAHKGGFTGFSQDITDLLTDSENKLTVIVDSTERDDTPPYGAPLDFLSYGGIYRDVWIEGVPQLYIKDTFINPMYTEKGWKLDITGEIAGEGERKLTFSLYDGAQRLGICQYRAEQANYHVAWTVSADVIPWTPENPKLYTLRISLSGDDELEYSIGFRQIRVAPDGFYLNSRKIKLIGINRMQNYAYEGFAMPASAQRADADLIKSLGFNAVRCARYPQSRYFVERCSEIGLMVLWDIPGYKYAKGGDWFETLMQNVRETVTEHRNETSIVMWGTRTDDSKDIAQLNRKIADTVRALDNSRPTYGVHCFKGGDSPEDVYGYNDYSRHSPDECFVYDTALISPSGSPVIITEHTGHNYPARSCGSEKELLSQALSHARMLDAVYGSSGILGSFGWCLCDYNTHAGFGGNDGVCSYGICDMNRIPKLAASVYTSQNNSRTVLEISSAMLPGEHGFGILGDVYAFTNCDSVRLYKNDELISEFFPDRRKFPHLPHPPILINDLAGGNMAAREGYDQKKDAEIRRALKELPEELLRTQEHREGHKSLFSSKNTKIPEEELLRLYREYSVSRAVKTVFRFDGVINGQVAASVVKEPVCKTKFKVNVSSSTLIHGETYDVARIEIVAVDSNDNRISYFNDCLSISCDGALEVIGSSVIPLIGGGAAFYLRTKGGRKQANLTVSTQSMGAFDIPLSVIRKTSKELNISKTEEQPAGE